MRTIYLDNAATSFPKPVAVGPAMLRYLQQEGAPVGRSAYAAARRADGVVYDLRERLCRFFHFAHPDHAILTSGATFGLNLVLQGALGRGGHCIVSALEHNAVMRPLNQMADRGVSFDRIPCDGEGRLNLAALPGLFRPDTKLVVVAHGSNLCGVVQDLAGVAELCRARGVPLVADCAQTAGHLDIDMTALGLSALVVPGHKGLLGPGGVGAVLLDPAFAKRIPPLTTGGTGSRSDLELQPDLMPDRFESGTPNVPGIYGLNASLEFLETVGLERIRAHEVALMERFLSGMGEVDGVRLLGPKTTENRVGVFALDFEGRDNAEAAFRLETEYGILTRCGLHCAPAAHRALGTYPQGAVRLSFSYFTTGDEVDAAIQAVKAV